MPTETVTPSTIAAIGTPQTPSVLVGSVLSPATVSATGSPITPTVANSGTMTITPQTVRAFGYAAGKSAALGS